MTRLSRHRFRANEALWLSVIAYNLGNLWRLALPTRVATWSLTSLQQRLVKTGGQLIKHARYYWLLLAESHLRDGSLGTCCKRSGRYVAGGIRAGACSAEQISMTRGCISPVVVGILVEALKSMAHPQE